MADRLTLEERAERGSLPLDYRDVLLAEPCVYCLGAAQGLDHILSRSAGGTHGWGNRAPACCTCDSTKGKTSLLLFLVEKGSHD